MFTFNWNSSPDVYIILLFKIFKIVYQKQKNNYFLVLILTEEIYIWSLGLVLLNLFSIQWALFKVRSLIKKILSRVFSDRFLSYSKKVSLAKMTIAIRCHSSFVGACCDSLYHFLSHIVPLVVTRFHSLSLDLSPVCLFITDQKNKCEM